MKRLVIIGAGLAGLTAAFRCHQRADVVVLEASSRLGGQLLTEQDAGFLIERGGEGFVARSSALPALVRDLGWPESELIEQALVRSYGFDGQVLRPLAPGEAATLLGFGVPKEELGRGIRSLRRGMGSLIERLADRVQGHVRLALDTSVSAVAAQAGALAVHTAAGQVLPADVAIVATSAAAAARLLAPLLGSAAQALERAATMSSVTVELAFERAQIAHPLDGTGFVVALDAQQDGVRACTFTSSKFADRAPPGGVSLRVFIRPSSDELSALDEPAWIARARAALSRVLPISGEPRHSWVSVWPNALPVFDEARRAAVLAAEAALAPYPIRLAGAAFHGAGIDAAVRSAEQAAAALCATLG